MSFSKTIGTILTALMISGSIVASPAQADALVTYSWTTTSVGPGPNTFSPTASFEVPLSDVLAGKISQFDVSNIQITYPGLTFDSTVTSGIGFDFAAFVNPTTGAFIFSDANQGFVVEAFAGTDINAASTFVSMTVDNPVSGIVKDQFNAINNGQQDGPFPNAGLWTATFPTTAPVPLHPSWPLTLLGFAGIGFMAYRRRKASRVA